MSRVITGFSISLLVHLAFFLPMGINSNPNPFQVVNAPYSLEVTLAVSRATHKETSEMMEQILPFNEEEFRREKSTKTKEKVEKDGGLKESVPSGLNQMVGAKTNMEPSVKKNPPPIYPIMAREYRYEGFVELRIQVLISGKVGKIEVLRSSGHKILVFAAREAIRKWLFTPARKGNKFVESSVVVPVNFQLVEDDQTLIGVPYGNQQ